MSVQVRSLFSAKLEAGDIAVEGVRVVRDKATLVGKGFGYVLLADRALAAAVRLKFFFVVCPLCVVKVRWQV